MHSHIQAPRSPRSRNTPLLPLLTFFFFRRHRNNRLSYSTLPPDLFSPRNTLRLLPGSFLQHPEQYIFHLCPPQGMPFRRAGKQILSYALQNVKTGPPSDHGRDNGNAGVVRDGRFPVKIKKERLHDRRRSVSGKAATTYPPGRLGQVLWARESLTSVFGMGTGGSSLLSSPPWYMKPFRAFIFG